MQTFFASDEQNTFTKNRSKGMSGLMNVSSCLPIDIKPLKKISQANKCTINDVILSSLTTSLNTLFKEQGDDA